MKKVITTVLILSCLTYLTAQETKIANHLFEKRSYIAAAKLYLKEKNKTQEIYEKLGDCYFFNVNMEEASKWYKLLFENYPEAVNPTYYFRYAQTLKGVNDYKQANEWLKKYHKEMLSENENIENKISSREIEKKTNDNYTIKTLSANTEASDFGGAFYGKTLVFSSTRTEGKIYKWDNQPYLDLYQADIDTYGELQNIQPFSSTLNTVLHESNAVFTKDGKTVYFTRNNLLEGKKKKDKNKVTHLKIYKATLSDNNEWTDIVELPFNNDNYSVEHPALSADEKKLYFSSDMPGSIGLLDLFVVDINEDGTFGDPKNLGATINTIQREQFPYIHKDTLYFASDGHIGLGGLDVFKSYLSNEKYSIPTNLGKPINSNLDDFGIVINDSLGMGYFSSNRTKGKGGDDIYGFTIKESFISLKGFVKDKNTLKLIPNTLVVLYDENDSPLGDITVGEDASYSFKLKKNKTYKVKAVHKHYVPSEVAITLNKDYDAKNPKIVDILLVPYTEIDDNIIVKNNKTQIKHPPIYFDLNSSYLRPDAKKILDDIVAVIKKYPEMKIACNSHTDSRESHKYNLWLSKRRATRTVEYIISKGISSDRISKHWFGETELVNNCSNGVKCSEKQHQLNRRTEFVLK